ncbi:MAG TPA: hypothetical protein VLH40_02125 [Atribacteraceae bacterium]|nr:hypothetical protein [Atribacteraceae bacterium]
MRLLLIIAIMVILLAVLLVITLRSITVTSRLRPESRTLAGITASRLGHW